MRVSEPFNTAFCFLEIPLEEVKKHNAGDRQTKKQLKNWLVKYEHWCADLKKIKTKELLSR